VRSKGYEIPVLLYKSNWRDIQQIISECCEMRSTEWRDWANKINAKISSAIDSKVSEKTIIVQQFLQYYQASHTMLRNSASQLRNIIAKEYGILPEPGKVSPCLTDLKIRNFDLKIKLGNKYNDLVKYATIADKLISFGEQVHYLWLSGLVDETIVSPSSKNLVEEVIHTRGFGNDLLDLMVFLPIDIHLNNIEEDNKEDEQNTDRLLELNEYYEMLNTLAQSENEGWETYRDDIAPYIDQ
jgi:hypothetical protein